MQWSRGVVTIKELQVGVRGQTQVHVCAYRVVHSGRGRGWEVLKRVIVKEVSSLISILIKTVGQRGPAYIVCECVGCKWSHTVSSCAASSRVLHHWVTYVPHLTAHRAVIVFRGTDAKRTGQSSVKIKEILTPIGTCSCIRVRGGAGGVSHVAAAAVLLHY